MSTRSHNADITADVSNLSLKTSAKKPVSKPRNLKTKKVADSWEDEDISDNSDVDEQHLGVRSAGAEAHDGTSAPPPTPISPTYGQSRVTPQPWSPTSPVSGQFADVSGASTLRPEKTDAVARRMIASALGMRAPKQTEEQKAYDRAVREKEKKRREEEKAVEKKRQEEAEKAKAAMWDD